MLKRIIHALFWKIFRIMSFIPRKKYGMVSAELKSEPKAPFLLLANHNHYNDGFFVGYFVKAPVAFLSTDEVPALTLIGSKFFRCILTEKGTPDFNAVKKMKNLIDRNISVGIFPEGDRTWDGESAVLNPNISKMVRLFNVPGRIKREFQFSL